MTALFIGLVIITILLGIYGTVKGDCKDFTAGFATCIFMICSISVGRLLFSPLEKPKPTAMDVYQGKTTLEYKVVDGIKIDSVVVWKKDNYEEHN